MKRKIGLTLVILSIFSFLFSSNPSLTGYTINSNSLSVNYNYLHIFSLIFFIVGALVLTSKKTLDAIIILGNPSEKTIKDRTKRALEEDKKIYFATGVHTKVYVVTGGPTKSLDPKYESEAQMIYKELRKAGIRPGQMRAERRSTNTIENLVYALKKVDGTEIGIVSNPDHLDRVEDILEKGKEDGSFNKDIHLYRIETEETLSEKIYEFPAKLFSKYQLRRGVKKAGSDSKVMKFFKYILEKFME